MASADLSKIEGSLPEDAPEAEMLKLVDVEKMAEILDVNKNWLYRRTMAGTEAIPHYRVGRHVRFLVSEVLAFLQSSPKAGKDHAGRVSYAR